MIWDRPTADWWVGEVAGDDAYERDVDPLLDHIIPAAPGRPILDLGCGDGRLADRASIGVDSSEPLSRIARLRLPVARADVTALPFGDSSVAGAFAVLVVEHLADPGPFFAEAARVVRQGGWLALVVNHPLWTPPGAGPFMDPEDGEILWRWGDYLTPGHSDEPAGNGSVRFHHRPMGELLTSAASAGLALDLLVERPIGHAEDALLAAQTGIPRLLGARWRR